MARSEARVFTRIWQDRDFIALPSAAQRMYLLALSQPGLSLCGVVDYTAKRWASLAPDTSVRDVMRALERLIGARFIIVDDDTEELWIRSFLKHDVGAFKNHNLVVAICRDYAAIASHPIRDGVAKGVWDGITKGFPDGVPDPLLNRIPDEVRHLITHGVQQALPDGLPDTPPEGHGNGHGQGLLAGVRARSPVPTPVPSPSPGPVPDPVPPPDASTPPPATPPDVAGDGTPADEETLHHAVATILGQADLDRITASGERITHPDRYLARCIRTRKSQHGADVDRIHHAHPDWDARRIAAELERAEHPETATGATIPDPDQTAAMLDQRRALHEADAHATAQADAAIANLDDHQRAELRSRAEAEVPAVGGRRPEILVAAAMRRIATQNPPS